jgi:magnesium-transporting ATPase (P-type)
VNSELKDMGRAERSYEDVKGKFSVLKMIPFNSETKKMTVVVELEHEKRVRVFTKGASENIIDDCAYLYDGSVQNGISQSPRNQ